MERKIGGIPGTKIGEIPICPCYCRIILALLVVAFAWYDVGYNQILHTILGILLMLLALTPLCCCKLPKKAQAKEKQKK